MNAEKRVDYIEIPVTDPAKARDFFVALLGWETQDWGSDYISFDDGRLQGGFRLSEAPAPATGVLVVFYSENLERDRARVIELDASISLDIFPFPGGRRFHFVDPVGNEYAFWSATGIEQE